MRVCMLRYGSYVCTPNYFVYVMYINDVEVCMNCMFCKYDVYVYS